MDSKLPACFCNPFWSVDRRPRFTPGSLSGTAVCPKPSRATHLCLSRRLRVSRMAAGKPNQDADEEERGAANSHRTGVDKDTLSALEASMQAALNKSPKEGLQNISGGKSEGTRAASSKEIRDYLEASVDAALSGSAGEDIRKFGTDSLDDLVRDGERDLQALGDDVSNELDAARQALADSAERLVSEELQDTLARFDARRVELMQEVVTQRDVIELEAGKIRTLADSLSSESSSPRDGQSGSLRQTTLFAVSGLLGIAALYYGWQGIIESSSPALQSSALDAIAAAAASYLYRRGEKPASSDRSVDVSEAE